MVGRLVEFSLTQRVFVLTLGAVLLFGGLYAFHVLDVVAYPDPSPPMMCGDTNMTAGDVGMWALGVHWRHGVCGQFTNFTNTRTGISVMCSPALDANNQPFCTGGPAGALQLAFVQTPSNESAYLLLDAVALVTLPMKYIANGAIVPGPGELGTRTGPAVIRNQYWLNNADTRKGLGDWEIVDPAHALPANMTGVIVAGGHKQPALFGIVNTAGHAELWRDDPATGWSAVDIGGTLIASGATYGSVFVNPFDPKHIFAIATDGVRVSVDGKTFVRDDVLTALVTASGKYSLAGDVGSNGLGVVLASRANSSAVISQIAFNRAHPHQVLVGAPFTGAFYAADDQRQWRNVGHQLPLGGAQVSSVGLDDRGGYVATEGRGVFAVTSIGDARLATLFRRSANTSAGVVATLARSDGALLAGASVDVTVLGPVGPEVTFSVLTDASGNVTVPSVVAVTGATVYLAKPSAKDGASSEATFQY